MSAWLVPAIAIIAAYLIGSVSFAWLVATAKGIDLRQHGSGNLGATNAGRVLGGRWFAVVLIGDLLKGLLPVLAGTLVLVPQGAPGWLPLAIAAAAVIGHVFTCFHGFKGGKAVATSLGVLIGLVPLVAGITLAVWLVAWLLARAAYRFTATEAVGPASIIASLAVVPARLATEPALPLISDRITTAFIIALAVLVLVRHRSNLAKLLAKRKPAERSGS